MAYGLVQKENEREFIHLLLWTRLSDRTVPHSFLIIHQIVASECTVYCIYMVTLLILNLI